MWVCRALAAVRGGSSAPEELHERVGGHDGTAGWSPSIVRIARGLAPGIATGAPSCRTWRDPKTPSSTARSVLTSAIVGGPIQYMVKISKAVVLPILDLVSA